MAQHFLLSAKARTLSGVPLPIPPSEIMAWCALTGNRLNPWEMRTLQALDMAFLQAMNEP